MGAFVPQTDFEPLRKNVGWRAYDAPAEMNVADYEDVSVWRRQCAAPLGVAKSTLDSAVNAGKLKSYSTACGLPLVTERDALKWFRSPRKTGPKPKK